MLLLRKTNKRIIDTLFHSDKLKKGSECGGKTYNLNRMQTYNELR